MDTVRTNMTMAEALEVVAFGLECGVVGMIRGVPGYDRMVPHIHWVLVDARSIMHPSTYEQIYNKYYGVAHGGGGLGGAPGVRWFGPPIKKLITWAQSKYNPKNGWRPTV
jgi:hypothetical protein